jgi:hypothetical protein
MAEPAAKSQSGDGRKRGPDWWLVAVMVLPILYFLPEVLGLSVFAGIDTSRLNMPLRFFDRQAFASGALPLWNPYMFAGFPSLGESESGVFYPASLFIHFPGDFFHWYSIEAVVHYIIAGVGFYLWLKRRGEHPATSAFLAATYCTTPFLIFHVTAFGLFTSIVWLPWYLLIFENGMNGQHPFRSGLWLALFLGIMLLSGSVQAAYLGMLGLILYALGIVIAQPDSISRKRAFVRAIAVLAPCIIAPFIAAIQIIPLAELSKFSERMARNDIGFFDVGTWLTIPRLASTVLFPAIGNPDDLQDYGSSLVFLGVVPFAFMLGSLARWRESGRSMFPLLFAGAIALILAFGPNLPGFTSLVKIPPFSLFRYPGRSAQIALTFFLAIAAPMISDLIGSSLRNRTWQYGYFLGSGLVIAVGLVGLTKSGLLQIASMVALGMAVVSVLVGLKIRFDDLKGRRVALTLGFLLCLSLIMQIALTYPFSRVLTEKRGPFDKSLQFYDDVKSEFPSSSEFPRVLMAGRQIFFDPEALKKLSLTAQEDIWDNMTGNASGLRSVTALNGLTPMNQNSWKLVLNDTLQSRIENSLKVARESGTSPEPDLVCLNILPMLGADVILLDGADWRVPGYELWRTDLGLPFHEGMAAYRASDGWIADARFVDKITWAQAEYPDFLRWIGSPDTIVLREATVSNPSWVSGDHGVENLAAGEIISRERYFNRMRFTVRVGEGARGFLVTGENYFPGWIASVDGRPADYYIADYVLGGLFVESGEHIVDLVYQPQSVWTGEAVSVGGLAVWAILMLIAFLVHRNRRKSRVDSIDG